MSTIRVLPATIQRTSTHQSWTFQPDDLGTVLAVELFETIWSPDEDTHPSCRPHLLAGVTTLTYVHPASTNALVRRDGLASTTLLTPGSSCITVAGSGCWVEEVPREPNVPCLGLRVHIHETRGTPRSGPQRSAPSHRTADASPLLRTAGAAVRVLLGTFGSATSPLGDAALVLDVELTPGGELRLDDEPLRRRAVLLLGGAMRIEHETELSRVVPYHLGTLLRPDAHTLVAGTAGARVLVIAGSRAPFAKPAYDGEIAAATWEQVARIREQAGRGELGGLSPSV